MAPVKVSRAYAPFSDIVRNSEAKFTRREPSLMGSELYFTVGGIIVVVRENSEFWCSISEFSEYRCMANAMAFIRT